MLDIKTGIYLVVNGCRITKRQLEALLAVQKTRSQNSAARELGIAPPVLHKYLQKMQQEVGVPLLAATPLGTCLTDEGEEIAEAYRRNIRHFESMEGLSVACTPVTQWAVLKSVTALESSDTCPEIQLHIGDDNSNLRLLDMGIPDLIIFDDPLHAYNSVDLGETYDVGVDALIHHRSGDDYARYRYGAQRIGFRYLEDSGIPYRIASRVSDIGALMTGGMSFFINRSIIIQRHLGVEISRDKLNDLTHTITALLPAKGGGGAQQDTERHSRALLKEISVVWNKKIGGG